MVRLFSVLFFCIFSTVVGAQETIFVGRVDLGRDLASFEASPAIPGTLYLLTGAAAAIHRNSDGPFVAEVEFVQAQWLNDADLNSSKTLLRFEGDSWADLVVDKKPRKDSEKTIYPYRKFQVAALASERGFRVLAVTSLF